MFWIQYVVGYDSQEQRSLAKSFGNSFYDFRSWVADKFRGLKEGLSGLLSWVQIENEDGSVSYTRLVLLILISAITIVGLLLLVRRLRRSGFWRLSNRRRAEDGRASAVEFYERMTKTLAARGLKRAAGETPLEFAAATGMPEALEVTKAYNRVRFGDHKLSPTESTRIDEWLRRMEGQQF
jgi:hypothetical protein